MTKIQVSDRTFKRSQYARISPEQCRKLHWASLEVLERTGVRLFDPASVEIVRKSGAFVAEGDRIRIPSGLVEKALATVPKRVVLCTRNGERRVQIEGKLSIRLVDLREVP